MLQSAWDEIEKIYKLPHVDPTAVAQLKNLKITQQSHTKKEGNLDHYCSFFLPYDRAKNQIYLGDHIKAQAWIPPGGHIEPGETPSIAAIREMLEELGVTITPDMLEPFNLSVTVVNRPKSGCMTHYDIWYLVHFSVQDFDYLKSEYHDARWFGLAEGVKQMSAHPHFAGIVAKLIH
jgi:8-oxo-dGTP diphosphatase